MPLAKRWQALDRGTVAGTPERWAMYELGTDGEVVEIGVGVLRDELKTALTYSDATQVRWETCQSQAQAEELAAEHRERAELD
ncbi:hypothetical protein A4G99_12760 [Haladaptatus sp. R4]|uniref:DUF7508 domain-containing protein n=1 Tax=Haladaptatus sp. R4 TaxID=1679489 RepID=UPI0007B4EAA8|nr:hypothetical protein [Haladaptatus sp. R4]KZN23730.1 hypothetical protein A4G99_12760 [Haladaptatus sp. R4]